MDSIVKLKKPIPREDGTKITQLKVRDETEYTLGDLLAIERETKADNGHERACAIIMRDNGILREEAELLAFDDYMSVLAILNPKTPETSETKSSG